MQDNDPNLEELARIAGIPTESVHIIVVPNISPSQATLADEIAEAISDTLDMDWQPRWAAPNIIAIINRERRRAREEGAKAMQDRRKYPVLGTQGQAKVDWQFIEDHAKQAYENHRQTVERLAERGGLSWCELCAVIQDRKWSKMETADAIEQVRAAEARYLAALDPAQIAGGKPDA